VLPVLQTGRCVAWCLAFRAHIASGDDVVRDVIMPIQVLYGPRSTVHRTYLTAARVSVVVTALLVMTSNQAVAEYSNHTAGISGKTIFALASAVAG